MKSREDMMIDIFCQKADEHRKCKWWQFSKKSKLNREMRSALELATKFSNKR